MTSERHATTLPERRNGVNPHREKSRQRCEAKRRVNGDTRLSMGARVLYSEYDDYARLHGSAWPKQATLAARIGASVRSVQRWTRELQAAGHIAQTVRTGRACRHRLGWAEKGNDERRAEIESVGVVADTGASGVTGTPDLVANVIADTPHVADRIVIAEAGSIETACHRCGGSGYREYRTGGGIDSRGRREVVRAWRGRCGCSGG